MQEISFRMSTNSAISALVRHESSSDMSSSNSESVKKGSLITGSRQVSMTKFSNLMFFSLGLSCFSESVRSLDRSKSSFLLVLLDTMGLGSATNDGRQGRRLCKRVSAVIGVLEFFG